MGERAGLTVHEYGESHERALDPVVCAAFECVYARRWPGCRVERAEDEARQKAGIDVVLLLADGRSMRVDEKVRERDYGDFLVEEWSDRERGAPGWTVDPSKRTDVVAYAVRPAFACWFLPYARLRAACRARLDGAWRGRARQAVESVRAGRRWTTVNVPVPWREVFEMLGVAEARCREPWVALRASDIAWGWT